MHPYTVKNVKSFTGREGYGFNASLYRDGKKVAFVYDDASGGMVRFDWEDHSIGKQERDFEAYCKTLPQWASPYSPHETYDMTPDIFVSNLVDAFEIEKKMKSLLSKKLYFIQSDGKPYSLKAPYTPELAEKVKQRYSGCTILNTLPIAEAVARYQAAERRV